MFIITPLHNSKIILYLKVIIHHSDNNIIILVSDIII